MSNEFESFWKPFVRFFQSFCVSHYLVFRPNIRNSYIKSIPFLIYVIVIASIHLIILFVTSFKIVSEESQNVRIYRGSPLMYYVDALSVFGAIVTNLTIHLENIFYGQRENEICEKFQIINDLFKVQLNCKINYELWRLKYFKVMGFFLFSILIASISSFSTLPSLYDDKFFMTPIMVIGVIMTRLRWCQIALYLNMLADILNHLTISLKQHQKQSNKMFEQELSHSFVPDDIHYFREIYSHCWSIVAMMSDYFGWSMIAHLAKMTLESINGSFWFYVNQNTFESTQLTFRMIVYWLPNVIRGLILFLCF